jgi:hypothetical protein
MSDASPRLDNPQSPEYLTMNKERLLNVAKALRETKDPRSFNMNSYFHPCGTPACALGNYAVRRDLQSAFAMVQRVLGASSYSFFVSAADMDAEFGIHYYSPEVLEHFDIDSGQAEQLFGPNNERGDGRLAQVARTPIEAAEYIERFVADAA